MGLFGFRTKADKAREERNRLRQEIRSIEGSFDFEHPYFDCKITIHADRAALAVLTEEIEQSNLFVLNDDYALPKQDIIDRYGETRLYNFEPVPLEYRLEGDRVLVRCRADREYISAGTLPSDKAKEIIYLNEKPASGMKACFVGTKYKELSTEDFEHFSMDTEEYAGILITYRKENPSYLVKLARVEELKRDLAKLG